ncbi:MAG: erythromycin esterase family protein [Phycisphaerales bacterium]|nr:erythromycin esterase family protein [Phycisphaerales bacterium]
MNAPRGSLAAVGLALAGAPCASGQPGPDPLRGAAPPGRPAGEDATVDTRAERLLRVASPLRTIEPGEAGESTDLAPIARAVGEARVVLLALPDDGDGGAMLALSRVARFLHEAKGFDTVAWPVSVYEGRVLDRALRERAGKGPPAHNAVEQGLGPRFQNAAVRSLVERAISAVGGAGPGPVMRMTGYEAGLARPAAASRMGDELLGLLGVPPEGGRGVDSSQRKLFAELLAAVGAGTSLRTDEQAARRRAAEAVLAAWRAGRARLESEQPPGVYAWGERCLTQLLEFEALQAEPAAAGDAASAAERTATRRTQRARAIAANVLDALGEGAQRRRVLVWTTTAQAARGLSEAAGPGGRALFAGQRTVGDELAAALGGRAVYVLAAVSSSGEVGRAPEIRSLPTPDPGSPEGLWARAAAGGTVAGAARAAFLDLRTAPGREGAEWLTGPMPSRAVGGFPLTARWAEVFDGVILLAKTEPVRP